MKSLSVRALEVFRELVFRKTRACFEKCAADETHLALRDSVRFANASQIRVCALGWERLQVLPGTAAYPHCSPLRVLAGRVALSAVNDIFVSAHGVVAPMRSLNCQIQAGDLKSKVKVLQAVRAELALLQARAGVHVGFGL